MAAVLTEEPALLDETSILDRVREIHAARPNALDMGDWHRGGEFDCGTTHCLAGWAQCLSQRTGHPQAIGRELLPVTAATVGFFCSDKVASAWLKSRGYASGVSADAFRDELIGLGWTHYAQGDHTVSGGEVWADGQSQQTVSGGEVWAYGQSQQTVSGGVVWAYGQSQQTVSGGEVRAYGQSQQTVSGGEVWAYGQSQQTVSGGVVRADGQSQQTVSGGVVRVRDSRVKILAPCNCTIITEVWDVIIWKETGRKVYDADGNEVTAKA